MRRIVIANRRSPGDVVAMSAAVRDLDVSHPGEFEIHVWGSCPELWQYNPHVAGTWGPSRPRGAEFVEPDIRSAMRDSGSVRRHYLCAYHRNLERRLDVEIPVLRPHGDLHLSDTERSEPPIAGRYWVLVAGGKRDMPVKTWSPRRYAAVVARLRDAGVAVVQAGAEQPGHVHPRIAGTTDLRGRTDLREFLRLIHHSAGVVCPVTFAMHAAAAFEKPCVVLAGGREPWWWEAYVPGLHFGPKCEPVRVPHRYLHAIGRLECCRDTGCWRTHVVPDPGVPSERVCLQSVEDGERRSLPRCLDLIGVDDVVDAVLEIEKQRQVARGRDMDNDREYGRQVRSLVAGLVRGVLLARFRDEPGYVATAAAAGWEDFPNLSRDSRSLSLLLQQVARLRERFYGAFDADRDSIPNPFSDDDVPTIVIGVAIEFLHGDLDTAATRAARREPVAWDELADWSRLNELRKLLDQLPPVEGMHPPDGPQPDGSFHFRGKQYRMPGGQARKLITELWTALSRRRMLVELAGPVFDNKELAGPEIAVLLGGPRDKANTFFRKSMLPYKISKPRGVEYVVLVEISPPDGANR